MGQQQLLLLVLGAIIVGVAIIVGINMFSGSAIRANEDAVRQDCLAIAAKAEEWYRKPVVLGGGGKSFSLIGFMEIGYDRTLTSSGSYDDITTVQEVFMTNENGDYELVPTSSTLLDIEGTPNENTTKIITYRLSVTGGKITVTDETS